MVRQHARHVLQQATTSDVSETTDVAHNGQEFLDVDLGRGEEGLSDGLGGIPGRGGGVFQTGGSNDAADEREAVGVDAVGAETEKDVAFNHGGLLGKHFFLGDGADGTACGVVVFALVHAGHFGGFTTNEGAAGLSAAFGDTLDKGGGVGEVELAAAVVVEEHEWSGALDDEVVDVHGDKVNAYGVVLLDGLGDGKLGADAVNGADENGGVGVAGGGEVEFTAEATDLGIGAGAGGACDGLLDLFDKVVTGLDGDAGLSVGHGGLGVGSSVAEGAVGDVLAEERAFEGDDVGCEGGVGGIDGGAEGVADGVDGDDTAAGGLELGAVQDGAGVEDGAAGGRGGDGHGSALGVGAWIAAGGEDDGGAELGLDGDVDVVEVAVGAGEHDFSEIGLGGEEGQDGLRFGVAKADVVFEDLGSVGGDHETGEEDAAEWLLLATHALEGGLEDLLVNLVGELLGGDVGGSVAAHAAGVGALVAVKDALVVLGEGERTERVAVAEGEDGEFVTKQQLFDDNFTASVAKGLVDHDLLKGFLGLILGLGQDDSLAGSETGGLDDNVVADAVDVGAGLVKVGEVLVRGRGDVVFLHKVLGVGLAALEAGGFLGGTEAGDARGAEEALDAIDEGLFGTGDDEVDSVGLGELDEGWEVGGRDGGDVLGLGEGGGAAVARDGVNGFDAGRLGEFPGEGVFAAAVANEEDLEVGHGDDGRRVGAES